MERLVFTAWQQSEQNLVTLFRTVAAQQPEVLAVVGADGTAWSYRQLDQLSDQLAGCLQMQGVKPRTVVALLLDKSPDYILAALAILKTGAAYLPLELAYPTRFIENIFQEAKPAAVISKRACMAALPANHSVASVILDECDWHETNRSVVLDNPPISGADLAILGYSSGTTGRPKGVLVSHQAALYAYAKFWQDLQNVGEVDRFAYTTFIAWDALNPLSAGATGFVVPDAYCYDPLRLVGFFQQHNIQHTVFTPSLLNSVLLRIPAGELHSKLAALNLIWLGGEVTTHDLVIRALDRLPHTTFMNNYGPTECFVITQGVLQREDGLNASHCASVGRVLPEMMIRLQNEQGQLVAPGETGELLATGPCLADGYLANPELTAEKFIAIDGVTYYKTGDDAFLLADGRLVITGRHDSTVKVRGYNVNLAAIEALLKQETDIADCVVLAVGAEGQDKYLVAFVVATANAGWKVDEVTASCPPLSQRLGHQLAHYMVPSVYFQLDSIPVDQSSQKADKKQLLALAQSQSNTQHQGSLLPSHVSSALELSLNQQQELLRTVAERLLRLASHSLSFHDNLFDKGLHSLLAVELAMQIEGLFGCRIFIEEIFSLNSVTSLIAHIHGHQFKTPSNIIADGNFTWPTDVPPATNAIVPLPQAQHLLLTGVTGFVGIYMLCELLRHSKATITCLVRTHERTPQQRIEQQLAYYQLAVDRAGLEQRVNFVVGNLSLPQFGMADTDYQALCQNIDLIFHCAAAVNFIFSYSQLKTTNVDGTRHLAQFALTGRRKMIHFVSTTGVYPEPQIGSDGSVELFGEDIVPEALLPRLYTGYSVSKCVAEKVVQNAQTLGLAINLYRPGNIGSDQVRHIANPQDTLLLVLNACRKIRAAPCDKAWYFEATPVDFVVEAIVAIAGQEQQPGQCLNIYSEPLEANRVFELLYQRGEIDTMLPFADWLQRLRQVGRATNQPMLQIMADTILTEEKFFIQESGLSQQNFQTQLQRCALTLPLMTPSYCIAMRGGTNKS